MVTASESPDQEAVEQALRSLWLADQGELRREDLKKAREVTALLGALARISPGKLIVEAAAGHAYLSLLGAELLGWRRLWLIERDPQRAARARRIAADLIGRHADLSVEVREAEIDDLRAWPAAPDVVVGLHACGAASDALIAAALERRAKHLYLVPCCYARDLPGCARAEALADSLGIARQAEVRRRFVTAVVDSERIGRLQAAGYEVTAVPFVPPTVTPHNLLLRARRGGRTAP